MQTCHNLPHTIQQFYSLPIFFLRFYHTILQLHNPMVCQDNFKISSYNSTKLIIHKKLYAFLSTILQTHNPQAAVYSPLYNSTNSQHSRSCKLSSLQFCKHQEYLIIKKTEKNVARLRKLHLNISPGL